MATTTPTRPDDPAMTSERVCAVLFGVAVLACAALVVAAVLAAAWMTFA